MRKQRHRYEYKVRPNTTGAKVVRMAGKGKRILELGPGPGSITQLLRRNSCHITALENDAEAIDIVSPYCDAIHQCDLNSADWDKVLEESDRFEVIVAADVLEHLYDPWTLLKKLHPLLTNDGRVIASLPNAGHNAVISCLLTNDFEYRPSGLLDRTHIRFFGIRNIQEMFQNAGFKIVEADFVFAVPEKTEFAARWRDLPSEVRQALLINRFGSVYQVVVNAVRESSPEEGIDLDLIEVPPMFRSNDIAARSRRTLGDAVSFLGSRMREGVSRLLGRMGRMP